MWMAVGYESRKIYAKGKTKAECFRILQKKYPYKKSERSKRTNTDQPVYKEPLIITKRSR